MQSKLFFMHRQLYHFCTQKLHSSSIYDDSQDFSLCTVPSMSLITKKGKIWGSWLRLGLDREYLLFKMKLTYSDL